MALKKVVTTKYREQEPMLGEWLGQETGSVGHIIGEVHKLEEGVRGY